MCLELLEKLFLPDSLAPKCFYLISLFPKRFAYSTEETSIAVVHFASFAFYEHCPTPLFSLSELCYRFEQSEHSLRKILKFLSNHPQTPDIQYSYSPTAHFLPLINKFIHQLGWDKDTSVMNRIRMEKFRRIVLHCSIQLHNHFFTQQPKSLVATALYMTAKKEGNKERKVSLSLVNSICNVSTTTIKRTISSYKKEINRTR